MTRTPTTLRRANQLLAALNNRIIKDMSNPNLEHCDKEWMLAALLENIERVRNIAKELEIEEDREFYSDDNYGSRPGENGWHDYESATEYSESCSDRYENFRNQE